MRVFIAGASGFIGRALHERYAADGHEVRGAEERLVHFSSVTAFGFNFPDGVDEIYPVHNTYVPYPDTKIASEQVVLQAHIEGRIQATIVRPGDVYGPRSRAWAVIPVELIKARRFTLPGGGRGIHSPVYIDNLVDGVVLAAASPDAPGQIFTLPTASASPAASSSSPMPTSSRGA
jgi:nucleoside-diphosphate-sugar epimerase